MKITQTHILLLLMFYFFGFNTIVGQKTINSENTQTRLEAYKSSLANQQSPNLSRSMTASFTSGYDSELLESKLEYNSCVELAEISINIVDGINQIGTFSNGIAGAGLLIDEGVVLSTGTITEMFTDNNTVLVSEGVSDANTIADSDFDNLDPGGQTTHNESILILDFTVPPGLDGIRVPFQFASDEYPEYVGTQFNDVFGFFVSGPGFSNSTNIAYVPGTSIPIAVNSINGGAITNQTNADNYPASGTVYLDNDQYYIDNTDGTSNGPIVGEYDGYTSLLYAEVSGLIPGETYQLKLGIADIADHYGDSGVYIGPLEGLYTGEAIVDCFCDIENYDLDCDKDGIINGVDCDPEDASISESGDACVDSNGDAGSMDNNCICIASVGGTSGGNSGGLESNNRLAQKIAKRNFNKKYRPSKLNQQRANGEIPYTKSVDQSRQSGLDLSQVIPLDIWGAYIAESSPDDLIAITNAVDIFAADYYLNEVRSAVVLAIESENGVYEHAKYICDRLDGASLLDVQYINLSVGDFIVYKIKTASGLIEYATSFSGYIANNKFEIENHWSLGSYPQQDQYFNFQVWASSIEKTQSLLLTILDNVELQIELGDVTTGSIPPSFISNGYYKNGKLRLNINNKGLVEELSFKGKFRETETSEFSGFETLVSTNLLVEESITIETGYLYDMGLSMVISEEHSDELFIADGTWGYDDLNPNSEILEFNITNQQSTFEEELFGLERGIEVVANIMDYQNIFRSITPKWNSVDLSDFDKINFKAFGNGVIQLNIVNEQITEWDEQLSYQLVLMDEMEDYEISLKDFDNYESELDLSSISMIVISMLGDNNLYEEYTLTMNELNFSSGGSVTSSEELIETNTSGISPNPVDEEMHLVLKGNSETSKQLKVYNISGQIQIVYDLIPGQSVLSLDLSWLNSGQYYIEIIYEDGMREVERFIKK